MNTQRELSDWTSALSELFYLQNDLIEKNKQDQQDDELLDLLQELADSKQNLSKEPKFEFSELDEGKLYYKGMDSGLEAIDIIEDFELNFNLGNALKYILRCNYKEEKVRDLKKAMWYIKREMRNEQRLDQRFN